MFPPKKVEGLVETTPETRRGEGNPFVGKRTSQTHSEKAKYVSVVKEQQEVQQTPDLTKETNDEVARELRNDEKLRSAMSNKNVPIWIKKWSFRPKSVQFLRSHRSIDNKETWLHSDVKFIGKLELENDNSENKNVKFIGKRESNPSKKWGFRPNSIQNLDSLLENGNSENKNVKFIGKRESNPSKKWGLRPNSIQNLDSLLENGNSENKNVKFIGKRESNPSKKWGFRPNSIQNLDSLLENGNSENKNVKFIGKRESNPSKKWGFRPNSIQNLDSLLENGNSETKVKM